MKEPVSHTDHRLMIDLWLQCSSRPETEKVVVHLFYKKGMKEKSLIPCLVSRVYIKNTQFGVTIVSVVLV